MEETERPSRGGKISLVPVVSSEKVSSSSSGTGLLPLFEQMSSTVGCIHGLVEEAIWMT